MRLQDPTNELMLYARHNSTLYHNSYVPVARRLLRDVRNHTFDEDLCKILWENHYNRVARDYHATMKLDGNATDYFPRKVIKECARYEYYDFMMFLELGELDHLEVK